MNKIDLITRLKKKSSKLQNLIKEDAICLNQILDNNLLIFLDKLANYLDGNITLDFINDYSSYLHSYLFNDCVGFFQLDANATNRAMIHNDNSLLLSLEFSPKFAHLEERMLGHNYKVDITRSIKPIPSNLEKTISKLGIKPLSIIDIEFFEYKHPDKQLYFPYLEADFVQDLSIKYNLPDLKNNLGWIISYVVSQMHLDYNKLIEFYEDIGFYFEKEKIHLQYLLFDNNGKLSYLPVYIGIGTNEPLGIRNKSLAGKNRYYILDLLNNKCETTNVIKYKQILNLNNFFQNQLEGNSFYYDVDTYKYDNDSLHKITFTNLDSNGKFCGYFDISVKFLHNKIDLSLESIYNIISNSNKSCDYYKNGDIIGRLITKILKDKNNNNIMKISLVSKDGNIIGDCVLQIQVHMVSIETKVDYIDEQVYLKSFIDSNWNNLDNLLPLLINSQNNYKKYNQILNSSINILSKTNAEKIHNHLINCCGNIYNPNLSHYYSGFVGDLSDIAADLDKIDYSKSRINLICLLLASYIDNGFLDTVIIMPEETNKTNFYNKSCI